MDPSMTGSWQPTASLARSVATATTVLFVGVALGRPELLVLAAPFGVAAALAVAHAPGSRVQARLRVANRWLHEGKSTRLEVAFESSDELEQVTAVISEAPYVAIQPASGACSATVREDEEARLVFAVSPRRWGQHPTGPVVVAATTPWDGFRWGPHRIPEPT